MVKATVEMSVCFLRCDDPNTLHVFPFVDLHHRGARLAGELALISMYSNGAFRCPHTRSVPSSSGQFRIHKEAVRGLMRTVASIAKRVDRMRSTTSSGRPFSGIYGAVKDAPDVGAGWPVVNSQGSNATAGSDYP